MAFRMQDLMADVSPDKANPECTCQITVGRPPLPPDTGEVDGQGEGLPSEVRALTAGLFALKAQLRDLAGREAC